MYYLFIYLNFFKFIFTPPTFQMVSFKKKIVLRKLLTAANGC